MVQQLEAKDWFFGEGRLEPILVTMTFMIVIEILDVLGSELNILRTQRNDRLFTLLSSLLLTTSNQKFTHWNRVKKFHCMVMVSLNKIAVPIVYCSKGTYLFAN